MTALQLAVATVQSFALGGETGFSEGAQWAHKAMLLISSEGCGFSRSVVAGVHFFIEK